MRDIAPPQSVWKGGQVLLLAAVVGFFQLSAKPLIFHRAVLNSASFTPPGVAGGAIAQGSVFTIFGRDIGPPQWEQVSSFPLRPEFHGVSIQIVQGATVVDAIPIFVFATQVNAIMPSDAPLGAVTLRLTFNGEVSNPVPVTVVAHSVGIFTATGLGFGPAAAQNFISQTEQPINAPAKPARPGQVMTLWATGLGPIEGADGAPPPVGNLPFEVEITIGDRPVARLDYSGRTPCCAGIDQFVFRIPEDAPEGCYVPVRVRVQGEAVSNTATIAIQKDGEPCSEPDNPLMAAALGGGKVGAVALMRTIFDMNLDVLAPATFTVDHAAGYFRQETGGEFPFNPLLAFPPANSCTAYAVKGDVLRGGALPFLPPGRLDAGNLALSGPAGTAELPAVQTGQGTEYPAATIGGPQNRPGVPDEPLFLSPGNVRIDAAGGADVGSFAAAKTVAASPDWTNRSQFSQVDRRQDLVLQWGAPGGGRVVVAGINVDRTRNVSGLFLCVAPEGATSFRVPADVLANLPATRPALGEGNGFLAFGSLPDGPPAVFAAPGLSAGAVIHHTVYAKRVRFR